MTHLPPHLLDAIYAKAMEKGNFYVTLGKDLSEVKRIIAQRFVDAIDAVRREETEAMTSDD